MSAPCPALDDTPTILVRDNVDSFLQQLNSQKPSIRFTIEAQNDSNIAFLETSVSRESDGRLTTRVYRKPTHTDQYVAYVLHLPQLVKRGIVQCLYDRAYRLVTKRSVISMEKKLLSCVLVSYGYPLLLCAEDHQGNKARTAHRRVPVAEFKSTAVLPYVYDAPSSDE